MFRRRFSTIMVALGLILLLYQSAAAQSTYGSIVGSVADSTGAAVSDAQVTLTSLGTAQKRTVTTSTEGLYTFVNLAPGPYRVDVEKQGFKRFVREPIVVEVQQSLRIDVQLQVGEFSQTVTVSSETPFLQPNTSSLGQVVEGRKANELPLNGRNVFNLVSLAPSVVPQGQSGGTPVGTNPFGWGNYQIGGSFGNQSAEYLDGQPLNIGYINLPVLIPTQDSVQEFKVQTNSLGPEWGKFSGGVINISTKSGTNQIHGQAYEFLRNRVFNSNNFFSNRAGIETSPFTQNQFGANAGGPVYLPKLYDGRNKTFWFFSWEGFRLRQGATFTTTVPTALQRQGIFTETAAPIYDPLNVTGGQRAQFANNTIPDARIDPTARALLNLFPMPTGPGTIQNYTVSTSVGGNQNQVVTRLDHTLSAKSRIYGRFSYWDVLNLPVDPLGTGVCVDRCTEIYSTKAGVIGYNYTFTPHLIADLNFSASRFKYNRNPTNAGFDLTQIGWAAALNNEVPDVMRTPPTPCILGMTQEIMCSQGQSFIQDRNTQFTFSPSMTYIRGRHTFQFGGQIQLGRDNYTQTNIASGAFAFDNTYTSSAVINGQGGLGFASFLLGYALPQGNVTNHFFGAAQVPAFTAGQQIYRGVFFGDTWKVTNKLTLNLGLRYEQQGPWSERFDRMSYFDPNAASSLAQASGLPNLKGETFLVGTGPVNSRNNFKLDNRNFAPRVGLAYSLNPKTVIRSGYGIFWIPTYVSFGVNPLNDSVSLATTVYTGSTDGGATFVNRISNAFPNGIATPPGRNVNLQQFLSGKALGITDYQDHPYGYVQQWNLNVQRELPAGLFVDVAYAGSKGTHLPAYSTQIDQLPNQYLSQGASLLDLVPNPFFGALGGNGTALGEPDIARWRLLRPFPQFDGVQLAGQGVYDSIYHALQLTVQRRFANGGSLLVAYTASKLISNTDTITSWLEGDSGGAGGIQDNYNLRGERSISSQDVPQRLSISYVLDLPIGPGKKFLSGVRGKTKQLVGGWGIQGVTTFQSGFPLKFTDVNQVQTFGAGARPNRVAGCNPARSGSAQSRLDGWFDRACFAGAPDFTFGNESRVDPQLRQHGINNFDFALFKTTKFGPDGRYGVQFRTEFFNLFNRVQFGPPTTNFADGGGTANEGNFGKISSQINNPRLVQFALKFQF
ncbi:MAG TPA: TonB-dependent receptor [Blastocatellia bacterium]|nr:TonB-dependent receptor [Blastocatellia bacterium]